MMLSFGTYRFVPDIFYSHHPSVCSFKLISDAIGLTWQFYFPSLISFDFHLQVLLISATVFVHPNRLFLVVINILKPFLDWFQTLLL